MTRRPDRPATSRTPTSAPRVCVIIAAKDAAGTIATAVASALAEPEVGEVIVVDDGSGDDTAAAAARADDASGRLRIERLARNRGPSAARNHALELATGTHVAILDADDRFMRGRFAALFAQPAWDVIADNIAFVPGAIADAFDPAQIPALAPDARIVTFAEFVAGNVSRYAVARSQLGFVKPVVSRALIAEHRLRYDETLRLGEDFVFLAGLLARGARFALIRSCGYVAIERSDSLSAAHGVDDLAALLAAERGLARTLPLAPADRRALSRRIAETGRKHALRRLLHLRRERGRAAALADAARRPGRWYDLAEGIALDKARAVLRGWRKPPVPNVRLLL